MNAGAIGAVVLAAGQSRRMGTPKMVLPWGSRTVIEQVVSILLEAGAADVVVVTGGAREQVEAVLAASSARCVYNPIFAQSEMLTSLQTGIRALTSQVDAVLVVLGDQPAINLDVVRAVIDDGRSSSARIVIPSYNMRRGHPWLVARSLWPELLSMPPNQTMRDFLQAHAEEIRYVTVDSPSILKDIDTPEDYKSLRGE